MIFLFIITCVQCIPCANAEQSDFSDIKNRLKECLKHTGMLERLYCYDLIVDKIKNQDDEDYYEQRL